MSRSRLMSHRSSSVFGAPAPATALTILYVDDDPDIRTIVSLALGRDPAIRAIGAASGPEALTLIENGLNPDGILLDVMIGETNGVELYGELRKVTVGLLIGAFIPAFHNSRMGLSAHTTAVQCGIALLAFAIFWPHFAIPGWAAQGLTFSLIGSSGLLVLGLCLAAASGASRALPIAGKGFGASDTGERAVAFLTIGSSVWMLLASVGVCFFAFFR
ncbi:response regulator [Qipengyuania sp. MTN3-11]|uniref:response regulator n=1 Tax=Qipengyuania sp. MTN3-11 TaxID=3056557 RepID=UPI0036F42691